VKKYRDYLGKQIQVQVLWHPVQPGIHFRNVSRNCSITPKIGVIDVRNEKLPEGIEALIYLIRGHKVLLDEDIAALYGVETRLLTRAVRRNKERFPDDFMIELTIQEVTRLRSQIGISKEGRGGRRYLPMAFTEQGVAMLSSVLRSSRAIQVNIAIMRAFVKLRAIILSNEHLARKLAALEQRYDSQFKIVFDAIREIMLPKNPPAKRRIGFRNAPEE
jgi:hypothetical protein